MAYDHIYRTDFTSLNNSGVTGDAVLLVDNDAHTVRVDIEAKGLEPGQIHPQHIHGFLDGTISHSPTEAEDTDNDGFIELVEGLPKYGPVQLNLTLNPDDSVHDHGDGHDHTGNAIFPTVGGDGVLSYHQTFFFDPDNAEAQAIFAAITPLDIKEIVLHGESVPDGAGAGTDGEVEGTGGYKELLPVASGELHEVTDSLRIYSTHFTALNNSGVNGDALLVLDQVNHDVTVRIHAEGLEPGQVHAQHIHGFTDGTIAHTPTEAQDTDQDGFVELAEGLATYGAIQLNLTLNPDDSVHDHGDGHDHTGNAIFPVADENGVLDYRQTFHFDVNDANANAIFAAITPLDAKEIVLHGESVPEGAGAGTDGEVDGTGGYKDVLPVASGELHDVTQAFLFAGVSGGDWLVHA